MGPCPACSGASTPLFPVPDLNRRGSDEMFNYHRCSTCGLIFLSPVPDDLGRFYVAGYHRLPSSPEELASSSASERYKVDIVRKFVPEGRLLEIGPSTGAFLYLAKEAGFTVEAIEMDPECCAFLERELGVRTVNSPDLVQALRSVGPCEVIVLWHVLEHMKDPLPSLEALAGRLQPGGHLILSTPNPGAWQFRVMGRRWPHVDAPRHVTLISPTLLETWLSGFGLEMVWRTTADPGSLGWNIFGWQFFLSNRFRGRFAKTAAHLFGTALARLLAPVEKREGRGSAYTAVFRKRIPG